MLEAHPPRVTIDFESRSACAIKTHGAWRYSIEPSTEILCLAFRLPFWEEGRTALWHPAFPHLGIFKESDLEALQELFQWIEDNGLVEAHNVWFEFCIWQNIFVERYGAPAIRLQQWRCSAAKAAACALPRALEKVAAALHVPVQKDLQGQKAMQKMMKPRKPRKAEWEQWAVTGETPPQHLWHESRELLEEVWAYCRVDVLAEEAVSQALPDLSPHETRVFLADLAINARGFQLDLNAVTAAQILTRRETQRLNAELTQLTDRAVTKATQRTQMLEWFAYQELDLPDTQAATIDGLLASPRVLKPVVRRALEVVRAVGRSSTAKYGAMAAWMGDDARIRGGLQYHGASTGRWSGKGVQPHNFPRGVLKKVDQADLWEALCSLDPEQVQPLAPTVLEGLSHGLRGAIVASPGKQLYIADYASIEARVLLWLADDQSALDMFRQNQDIYLDMASTIYDRPCTKEDTLERQLGKVAILGLGYQMGWRKFQTTCGVFGIPIEDDLAERVVRLYREKYYRVKDLWRAHEEAVVLALSRKRPVECDLVTWEPTERFLYAVLPSGRRIAYPFPKLQKGQTPWGEDRTFLSFMGVDSYTRQWVRQTTYGGMLIENVVQSCARDLMADAILRCERLGRYQIVLSVHDELIAEADLEMGSVAEFERLLTHCPAWATGCPVAASGWGGLRYAKG